MKCREVQVYLVLDPAELPAQVVIHLEHCDICRAEHDKQLWIRQLIALKRFEQPSEQKLDQCFQAIQTRLKEGESEVESQSTAIFLTHPTMRTALAAACLMLIAYNAVIHMSGSEQDGAPTVAAWQPAEPIGKGVIDKDVPMLASTNFITFPWDYRPMGTNLPKGNPNYGTQKSIPVSYSVGQ